MSKENAEQEYSVYFRNFLSRDDASAGYIDPAERKNLRLKRMRLGISEESANIAEMKELEAAYPDFKTEIIIPEEKADFFSTVLKDDLRIYAGLNLYISITIIKVFSEGMTSAQVFEAECRRAAQKKPEYKLLKYDYYPKILKEYLPSIEEITKDVYDKNNVTAIENQMPVGISKNGFLELKAFYRKASVERVFSFKTLLSDMRRFDSDYDFIIEDQNRTQALLDAVRQIFSFLFNELYINPEKNLLFRKEPLQNSVEFFLPPRRVLSARLEKKSEGVHIEDGLKRVNPADIFGFDIMPSELNRNQGVLSIKFRTKSSPGDTLFCRLDAKAVMDYDALISYQNKPEEWDIYVNTKEFVDQKNTRENRLKELADKIHLPPSLLTEKNFLYLFERTTAKIASLDTNFFLDSILKEKVAVCQTDSLHGDLNASNILFGLGSAGGQISAAVIDLYDINTKGNIFFDAARYETDIFLRGIQRYLQKKHRDLLEKKEFGKTEQMFLLDMTDRIENAAYIQKFSSLSQNKDSFFIEPEENQPLFCLNVLNIIQRIFPKLKLNPDTSIWNVETIKKNYYLCMAVYALKFAMFPKEAEAVKLAALFLSMRYFSRMKDISESQTEFSAMDFGLAETASLNDLCRLSNFQNKTDSIQPELFTDFFKEGIIDQIKKFFQSDDRILFINGEIGSGKSVFIDFLADEDQYRIPVLKISGNRELKDKYSFLEDVREKLKVDKTESLPGKIGKMMKSSEKTFLFIIDEIYYNSNQELAFKCLRQLLLEMMPDRRFKFIVSVIPAYWSSLSSDGGMKELIQEKTMSFEVPASEKNSKYLTDNVLKYYRFTAPEKYWEEIVGRYFRYYGIRGKLKPTALRILSKEIWILKLFCEVKNGSNVGEMEQINFIDVLEQCLDVYHRKIASAGAFDIKKADSLFYTVSAIMESLDVAEVGEEDFLAAMKKVAPESKPEFVLMNAVSIGFLRNFRQKISFRFTMSAPAYYVAAAVCRNWEKYKDQSTEEYRWLLKKIETSRGSQFSELILFHIASILGKRDTLEDFSGFIETLLGKFVESKSAYSLLRIFGKSVSFIPNFNMSTYRLVTRLETECRKFKNTYKGKDFRFEREYGTCFSALENNVAVLRNSNWVQYMSAFEKKIQEKNYKPLILELAGQNFRWRDFKHFLTEDSRRNGSFLRNQMVSVMQGFAENYLSLENAVVGICENLLTTVNTDSSIEDFTQLNLEIYGLLFKCLEKSDDFNDSSGRQDKIFSLVARQKIHNEKVFENAANRLHQECEARNTPSYWVQFLLTSLDSDENSNIHSVCFQYMMETLRKFKTLDKECQKLILSAVFNEDLTVTENFFTKERLTLLKILYDALPESHIRLKKSLLSAVSEYPVYEKQEVYFVLIRNGEEFLLRYNDKWGDYNWIAERLKNTVKKKKEEIMEAVLESLEGKLKMSRKKFHLNIIHYPVSKEGKITSYLIKSKSGKRELKEYVPVICTLQSDSTGDAWKQLKSDPKHKLFRIDDIMRPINSDISPAVKMIISKIAGNEGILEKIVPNVL